jgi:Flp pilus assembly protein TadG
MATNTTVLLIVTAMAALVLAGVLAGVVYKTRAPKRVETVRDEADQDALRLRHQEVLADEFDARAHAAQVELDIKTVRACSLQQQATVHRSEAVTSRDQLNELRDSSDKLSAASRPPAMPGRAG